MADKLMLAICTIGILVLAVPVYDQIVPISPHGDDVELTMSTGINSYECTIKSEHTYLPLTRCMFPLDMYRFCQPDSCIQSLVDTIKEQSGLKGISLAREFMKICGQIRYVSDPESHGRAEYWQLPCETLQSGTGDCEDMAFLFIAMCKAAGFECLIIEEPSHISAAVKLGYGGATVEYHGEKYDAMDPTAQKFGARVPDVLNIYATDWDTGHTIVFAGIAALLAFFVILMIRK